MLQIWWELAYNYNNTLLILPIVPVRHHRVYPVNISAEATQLHLLALARLDRMRVCVHPLIGRNISRFRCVRQDVEHRRFGYHRQIRLRSCNVSQDGLDFRLYLRFWL